MAVQNVDHNEVLFRGYENKLILGQKVGNSDNFQIEAINCEVSKLDGKGSENTYMVKTKPQARTAKINFISNGIIIESAAFIVQNLPRPSLFWGTHKTGSSVPNSREIQMKYSSGVTLKPSFEIVSWKCNQKDATFEGSGESLSQQMLDYTKSMATGETIKIEVKVKGTDGIIREREGSWVK
jgi:hypothetical protein